MNEIIKKKNVFKETKNRELSALLIAERFERLFR